MTNTEPQPQPQPQILWRCMEKSSGRFDRCPREIAIMNETDAYIWLNDIREQRKEKGRNRFTKYSDYDYIYTQHWIEPFVVGKNPQQLPQVQTTCSCCNGTGVAWKPKYEKVYA